MASMTQDFNFFFEKLDILVLLASLKILSHYPDIDILQWMRENVQWIMDRVFTEMLMV